MPAPFVNLSSVHGKGLDLELAGKWANGWQGRLAYSLQDTRDEATGAVLTNSPKQLPKINFIAPLLPRRLFLSLDGQYLSQRDTIQGTTMGGFFVANATLSTGALFRGLRISASAYNLFDRSYADPGGPEHRQSAIGQDGRTLRLKLTYNFGE
jgi:iron complex outermembrane receptor protein